MNVGPLRVSTTNSVKDASLKDQAQRSDDAEGFTLRVLYLFAGQERKTSVASYLRKMAEKKGWKLIMEEVDIERDPKEDLSAHDFQAKIIARITSGEFHAVLCTPPCSTWTRVRMANERASPSSKF